MKMLVAAVGTVVPPIRIDKKRKSASFTLAVDADRFFVATVGLEQYERMNAARGSANMQLLILGDAYSFISRRCGKHHVGIKPLILTPLVDVPGTELARLQDVAAQWFAASLLTLNDKSLRSRPGVSNDRKSNHKNLDA